MDSLVPAPTQVTLRHAFFYWLKLGFISFGGPAGQISLMHQELVEKRRWISDKRFLHALNYTTVLPGPEAQQLATYIGWLMHGVSGGLLAGLLFVLPSLGILCGLTWVYLAFGEVFYIQGFLYGIKPAVTAIVVFAAYRIGSKALRNHALRMMAVLAFVAIFVFKIPFPYIVLGAALIGLAGAHFAPTFFLQKNVHASGQKEYGSAFIDDDTPIPLHARLRWLNIALVGAIGIGLAVLSMALLAIIYGNTHVFTHLSLFFTKAALLTFGGAYAVLPYVYQGAVEHYNWLTGAQMIDGLALGETTPGPLIMVVAFVGFIAAGAGAEALPWQGIAGACIATFFTFLPSFIFIFMGAPIIEATRYQLKLTAPLASITAAVVGAIVNLALFFAYHVLWPQGFSGAFESASALIGAAAFLALFILKISVIRVIGLCALAGAAYQSAIVFLGAV